MTKQNYSVRLEPKDLERFDVIAQRLAERAMGAEVTRAGCVRIALLRGIEVLEAEFGIKRKK